MAKTNKNTEGDEVSETLKNIERLIVLMLIKNGANQTEIGKALGIDQSTVSRRFPGIKTKPEVR